jgi:hypothetical protein
MTDEEIHNIYLHMSGKAEGLVEATGKADFPVMFARAILEYEGLIKDVENMASKSTYKEQLETKDEPVGWIDNKGNMICTKINESCKPLYTTPQRTWVGLTDEEQSFVYDQVKQTVGGKPFWVKFADAIEAKLKEKNT